MKLKISHYFKRIYIPLLLLLSITTQFCKPTQKAAAIEPEKIMVPLISYEKNILPIMAQSCTPCHFPERGKKKMLDTYEATKKNIGEILNRIQLHADDLKFMPFKSKKAPLTEPEINLFKGWVAQGMPK